MSRPWRLFVALPLPPPIIAALDERLAGLRDRVPDARWVPAERLHLTLRFLGQQPEGRVPDIVAALAEVSAAASPFPLRLEGSGAFGRAPGRPRVCWLGLEPLGAAAVAALATSVEAAVGPLALIDPGRPAGAVRVHLTVARRAPHDLPAWLETALRPGPPISWQADRLRLYRSHLEADAPRYESLWTGRLGRAAHDRPQPFEQAVGEVAPASAAGRAEEVGSSDRR